MEGYGCFVIWVQGCGGVIWMLKRLTGFKRVVWSVLKGASWVTGYIIHKEPRAWLHFLSGFRVEGKELRGLGALQGREGCRGGGGFAIWV